jgi:hypothetical protein
MDAAKLGFTPLEDTPYVRFLFKQLGAMDKWLKKQDEEITKLRWDTVTDRINKDYVEAVGPQVDSLKAKIAALQAHSKVREAAAKVANQAEYEKKMEELTLDRQGEEVQAASQNGGSGSEDVEMGG